MSYKITWSVPERKDFDGFVLSEAGEKAFEIPYDLYEIVYYAYKKRKKWVIRKSRINSVWCTNLCGVKLDNGWTVIEDDFYRLFRQDQMDDAIEFCLEKNRKNTVKIYNKDSWY